MKLLTLGQLSIEGSSFRRLKPLMLAAYLTVEGPQPRRHLAQVFWPGASDAMNSLSVALSQLRRGAQGKVDADESRAWSTLDCDALELRAAFAAADLERVHDLYAGPFLAGVDLELGEELEEWLFTVRESLAATTRQALVRLAEARAGQGRFEEAGLLAEEAYRLPGAAPLEPEELVRFHALLTAAGSPLAGELRREAESFGVPLYGDPERARQAVRPSFIGRERELQRLASLGAGEWAWIRGERGMGKTSLLRQLDGTYLPGRRGLPFATLEPLLGGRFGESEAMLLRYLASQQGTWLIDDWEEMDEESSLLLGRLRSLHPPVRVVATSLQTPQLPVDLELVLGPLSDAELRRIPEASERTGGLPELVGAYLRDEPLEEVLERRLTQLDTETMRVYLALSLLDDPDPALVRKALGLSGAQIAVALGQLVTTGLADASGKVRARQSALDYLEARPALAGTLALELARHKKGVQAFPLYQRARAYWEPSDSDAVVESYLAWGEELLRRGFARKSAEILAQAPASQEIAVLESRALEQAGLYKEALERLQALPDTPGVSALKSSLYWRLGLPTEAREAAERGLEGDMEARAESLNTLGVLARSAGEYTEAASLARRAAALWKTLGNQVRWVGALNNLGIARTLAGESEQDAFDEAMRAAGDNQVLRARTLLNVGWMHEQRERLDLAEEAYRESGRVAEEVGVTEVAAWAWNNLGVLYHKGARTSAARDAYEQALTLAQQAGEQRILGMVMANLAELTRDLEAWEEALTILEKAGHGVIAEEYRKAVDPAHFEVEKNHA